jgi:hypothetical protein
MLTLADGRTLAYSTIGASDGPVVCYQHGAPGGRLELLGLDDAGNTDMSWPTARDGYLDAELAIMALDDPEAAVARCREDYGHDGVRFFEGEMDLGPTDNAWLADQAKATALFTAMHEAFRQGVVGYAHDIWVQGRAWSLRVVPGAGHLSLVEEFPALAAEILCRP